MPVIVRQCFLLLKILWIPIGRKIKIPKGIGFLSACATAQSASQDANLERTLFSHYFCEGIKNWEKKEEEIVSLHSIQSYINRKISERHPGKLQEARIQLLCLLYPRTSVKSACYFFN
jgi:hypothetical protein